MAPVFGDERQRTLLTSEARLALRGLTYSYYWRVRKCRYFGYRRRPGDTRGVWVAMMRLWDGHERQKAIGTADDELPADARQVFTFHQALAVAEEWFKINGHGAAPDRKEYELPELFPEVPPAPPYTVGNAAKDYITWYRIHRRGMHSAYHLVKNQIIAPLGHIPLAGLNPPTLQKWFDNLILTPPILGTSRITGPKFGILSDDPESVRKRKNSANNALCYLKAILNRAHQHGYIHSDWAWTHVKRFPRVGGIRKPAFLEKKQVRSLVDGAREDAAKVIIGGISTGCRVGDLLNMKVGDYLPDLHRISLVAAKTDNLYYISLSNEGIEFFDRITKGRARNEAMFLMDTGEPWTRYRFRRQFIAAQEEANIRPRATFHILRHTYASHAAMAGIPFKVIASQLGHTTTQMVDQFYAHLNEDFLDEAIRERMPIFLKD